MVYNKNHATLFFCRNHLVDTPLDSVWHQKFREIWPLKKKPTMRNVFSPPKCLSQISKHVITSPKINMGSPMKYWFPKKEIFYWRESSFFRWSRPENLLDWRFQTVRLACWKLAAIQSKLSGGLNLWGTNEKSWKTFWSLYGVLSKLFWGNPIVFFTHQKKNKQNRTSFHYSTCTFFTTPHPRVRVNHHRCTIHALVHPGLCEDLAPPTRLREGDYPAKPWKWHSHFVNLKNRAQNENCSPKRRGFSHLPSSLDLLAFLLFVVGSGGI